MSWNLKHYKKRPRFDFVLHYRLLKNPTYSNCNVILATTPHIQDICDNISTVKFKKHRSKTLENVFNKYELM